MAGNRQRPALFPETLLNAFALLLAALLAGTMAAACSSSGTSQDGEEQAVDDALDRMRERMANLRDDEAPFEGEEGPSSGLDSGEIAGHDTSLLLEPRYGGALPDDDPRVLGVFRFRSHPDPIIDGDTVAVVGLDASLRLLGIDTEEKFRGNPERRMHAYNDFEGYVAAIYAESEGIPKFATPMGDMASEFARQFFASDVEVRLEYDDLTRTRGYFDRYLVYVFTLRESEWVNYNLECVRAGMSPYFTKYGFSARFHEEFMEAEAEAVAAQRGVWSPSLRHYPDYQERRQWWDRRGRAMQHFRDHYADLPNYVEISTDQDWLRLPQLEGQEITVFGTLGDFRYEWNPPRVQMSHRRGNDFSLISFRPGYLESLALEEYIGEYVYVHGRLNLYEGRPQFIVEQGLEVWTEP